MTDELTSKKRTADTDVPAVLPALFVAPEKLPRRLRKINFNARSASETGSPLPSLAQSNVAVNNPIPFDAGKIPPRVTLARMAYGLHQINEHCSWTMHFLTTQAIGAVGPREPRVNKSMRPVPTAANNVKCAELQ